MLSSADKPVATTWLDRLRLSKGISATENDDASGNPLTLDDFLHRNHHTEITASESPPPAPIPSDLESAESPLESGRGEWRDVLTDVISELFNFNGSSRPSTISGKKVPRKQPNPSHFDLELLENLPPRKKKRKLLPGGRDFATPSRSSCNKKPAPEVRERRRIVAEAEGEDEEEVEEEKDLIGFSRSEVTVIDTSFEIWKTEKMVFRRRNVWKVKEKKGKSQAVSLKKQKTKKMIKKKKKNKNKRKSDEDDGEITRKRKKMKMSRSVPDENRGEEDHDDP